MQICKLLLVSNLKMGSQADKSVTDMQVRAPMLVSDDKMCSQGVPKIAKVSQHEPK